MSVPSLPLGRFLSEGAVDKSVMINHTQTIHRFDGTVSGIHGTSQLKRHSEVVGDGEQALYYDGKADLRALMAEQVGERRGRMLVTGKPFLYELIVNH